MSKTATAPSAKAQLEQVQKRQAAASLRSRMEAKTEQAKASFRRAKAAAAQHSDRVMQAVEIVAGGAIAGAIEGAYPDAKVGPVDARQGFTLVMAGLGIYSKGRGLGAHALNIAEGAAASIASDFARGKASEWRGNKSSSTTPDGKTANSSNTSSAEGEGDRAAAVKRLRSIVMSTPDRPARRDEHRERRSGGGIPGRRANG